MNREEKRRFVTGVLVGALSAILFFGILFAGGILLLNREVQKEAEQTSGQTADGQHDWNKIRRKLGRIQTYVDRYYIFGDRLDTQLQEEYIYKGYMAALGDVYTTYYTKEEWQEMEEQTSGAYVGIGVLVQQDKNTGLVTVMKVFAGSPALDAGMKAWCRITSAAKKGPMLTSPCTGRIPASTSI